MPISNELRPMLYGNMDHKYTHVIGCAGIILPCLGIEMFDFFPLQKLSARGKVKQLVSLMLSNQTPCNLSCCPAPNSQ
jgi:hypothetical protein